MHKTVILKLGSTLPSLTECLGDFDAMIAAPLEQYRHTLITITPPAGDPLPLPEELAGLIITGSHCMVTDRHYWSERVAAWLPAVVAHGVPTLGICYGHQLLAHAFGGEVADNPNGREFGTRRIEFTPDAVSDSLLGSFTPSIDANLCHTQSVIRLPAGAVRLASSDRDQHQAFRIGNNAWGVQFHPEFGTEVTRAYIRETAALLRAEGENPELLEREVTTTPSGERILQRFMEIVSTIR